MSIEKINALLKSISRPIDFFGDISLEEIKIKYRKYAKYCHPDLVEDEMKPLAEETIILLNSIYEEAEKEVFNKTYNIKDPIELYKISKPIVEFSTNDNDYKLYECIKNGDITDTYRGLSKDEIVLLDICVNESDNELIEEEYKALKKLSHISIPSIIETLKINGKRAIVFKDCKGIDATEVLKEYGNLQGKHVVWILERMLSSVGYLHDNKVVHGNIKPENVLIDSETHNVMIVDYSLCISEANKKDSKYRIINDDYTPSYVNNMSRVEPNVDIYAVGKIAIYLLGGDVKRNAMPLSCDIRLRQFIRKLTDEKKKENDAWALWSELIELRNEIYGKQRFQTLEKKII